MDDQDDSDEVLRGLIDSNEWTKAVQHRENQIKRQHPAISIERKTLLLSRVLYEYAQHLETDEDFSTAITYYKECGAAVHLTRLIVKQHLELCYPHLQTHCIYNRLTKFWCNFNSLLLRETHPSSEVSIGCIGEHADGPEEPQEQRLMGLVEGLGPKDWVTDDRHLSSELSKLVPSLSNKALARLAHRCQRNIHAGSSTRLCNLYLCLDQPEAFVYHSSAMVKDAARLDLSFRHGSGYDSAMSLISYVSRKHSKREMVPRHEDAAESRSLLRTYVKLGMMDEALKAISQQDVEEPDVELAEMMRRLDKVREDRSGCADFDPRLSDKTLASFRNFIQSNQTLSTDSITVLIHLLGIFVHKLEPTIVASQREDGDRLEAMFKYTAKLLADSAFSCSESLLSSANGLISSVKDKLELISDNDAIRDSFRVVVDTVAGRCMIESRYKSATMLYSQIEDHVKAIKSLMRTGEVDTVINYALLVRDVTVSRITINYLRHLQVEPKVIDDFIKQSSTGH